MHHIGAFLDKAQLQAAVSTIAARQHGVITLTQLRYCGLERGGSRSWVRAGRIHRLHRGVYAVGHTGLSIEGQWMAAVLACGKGSALSHRSAAMLWGMLKPSRSLIHVTVPGTGGRARRRGVAIHRSPTLLPSQATIRDAIPVTKPPRTLTDLRRLGNRREYRRALRTAEFLQLQIGEKDAEADGTRSGLEARFVRFCGRHKLPRPRVNVKLGRYRVDFLWPAERIVVETDTFRTHGGAIAFEEDRERDLWLKVNGYDVVRITGDRLDRDPAAVADGLRSILRRARTGG